MKVFFDHYIYSYQRYGGVSKYISELLRNIPQENWICSTLFSNNQYLKDYNLFKHLTFLPKLSFKGQERIISELNYIYSKYKIKTTDFDVFHTTAHAIKFDKDLKGKPMVATSHDLLYQLYHKGDPRRETVIEIEKGIAKKVDKVITISQNTKNDLIKYWNIDENKISVIYHGVEKNKIELPEQRIFEFPYILYVGARSDYKNFSRFAKAFNIVSEKEKDIRLVCTGLPFSKKERDELHRLGLNEKTIHISATELEMAQLYNDAEMFVYPSLYEGFGMPILEAMVYDCPVVISNASCFPEIAEDAALYFDPLEVEDMAQKMLTLGVDTRLKKELIDKSRKRLTNFSWEKSAKQHMDVYQSLL